MVESGIITRAQLGDALRQQAHSGGRLGTNLVELGIIDEQTLASFLARQLSIPAANVGQIDRIAPAVLKHLSAAHAQKLRTVPVREDAGKLWVAMADPTDRQALEELAELCGRPVRAMVAPERLIEYALAKHYRVSPRPRRGREQAGAGPFAPPRGKEPLQPSWLPPAAPVEAPVYGEFSGGRVAESALVGFLDDAIAPPSAAPSRIEIGELLRQLAARSDDAAVFSAGMSFIAQDVGRVGGFLLRNGRLLGWRGVRIDAAKMHRASASLDEVQGLARLIASGRVFLGQLSPDLLGPLAPVLGVSDETLGVIAPASLNDRVVGCIIGVDGPLDLLRQKQTFDALVLGLNRALSASRQR